MQLTSVSTQPALTALLSERTALLARVGELEEDLRVAKSFGDLVDFVCDEWVIDAAIAAARAPLLAEIEALRKRAEDAERDAARYRAFFERGPVVCFDGREFVNKGECDSAIDAAIKGGAA
jgi:hypothetical protein